MAQKPDKFPDWATEEEIDEVSGQANFVEPPDFRKESGWTRREIPPRQWFNWLARKTGLWFRWLEDQVDPDTSPFMRQSENLADLNDASAGRDNLGVPYANEAEALAGEAEDRVIAPARFGDQSLTTNGYQVLPGGLIFQWFEHDPGDLGNNETFTVTFPLEFPNECFQVILSGTAGNIQDAIEPTEGMQVDSFTNSQVIIDSQWFSFPAEGSAGIRSRIVRMFAIGR